ncbi:MAG: hypothetical protein D4R72_07735 [Nitrosopumilales archaeon]|nr:MAG: hypothetical protein D4R72_07735 [Nitrosopumilales archaeon]
MPKRRPPRERIDTVLEKRDNYRKKDRKILSTALYLSSKPKDGASIYMILREANLTKQDQSKFTKEIMIPMQKDGWIEKITYSPRQSVYKITEKGQSALFAAKKLCSEHDLLSKLEAFREFATLF